MKQKYFIQVQCKNCNKTYSKQQDSNRTHCSDRCRKDFRNANKKIIAPKNCPECNNTHNKPGKFCSSSCSAKYSNARKDYTKIKTGPVKGTLPANTFCKLPHSLVEFCTCEICNTHFTRNSIHKGSRRVCRNDECFAKFKHKVRAGKCGGLRANSTRVTRTIYKGKQMDSGAELAFAKLLDSHDILWDKNSTIWFEYLPGKKYYPDFFLPKYNAWVEIKGKYYVREDDELRWKSVPNLEVIWSNNITLPKVIGEDNG